LLLQKLEAGADAGSAGLVVLSHLDRMEAAEVRAAWERIPVQTRRVVVGRTTVLADDNVDLGFGELARIGLKDPDQGVRVLAVEALWESDDRDMAREFTAMLRDDPSDDVRTAAARALRPFVYYRELGQFDEQQGDDVVEALRGIAVDEGLPVELRAMAVESLGVRGLPWVGVLIETAYYSGDLRLQLAAIRAMGGSADERWLEFALDQIVSDDPEFRYESAVACGEIGAEEAIEPLADLLGDDDSDVVLATIQALGEIGGEDALRYLREFRQRVPAGMEEVVDEAIEAAGLRTGELFKRGLTRE
jgi:HEAT repeat protein